MSNANPDISTKFLKGSRLLDAVRVLVEASKPTTYLAVAFWGMNAMRELGIRKPGGHIRIICNLRLGGTNPTEITELMKSGALVKHSDQLHAKVCWNGTTCIVGSNPKRTDQYPKTAWLINVTNYKKDPRSCFLQWT
jgi:hypothetical protein